VEAPSIAILVPVLARPLSAAPLVASIRQSTTVQHSITFLCSPEDQKEIDACKETGARVEICPFPTGSGNFAKKTNHGFRVTSEPFIFCGADDLTFTPGWDFAALDVAEATGAGVIGTWDGANPVVMKGQHSTHSLVRRSYAEDPGCTVDGTGAIYCELYDHQLVDNEMCETAQSRGAWAFADRSRVLHHHPLYDRRTAMDPTYEKALKNSKGDRILFMRRRRLWQRELREQHRAAIRRR